MAFDQAKLAKSLVEDSERATRIELASSVWKTEALPLSYARADLGKQGSRPSKCHLRVTSTTRNRCPRHITDLFGPQTY